MGGGAGEIERRRRRKSPSSSSQLTSSFPFSTSFHFHKQKQNRSRAWSWRRTRPRCSSEGAGRLTRFRSSPRCREPLASRASSRKGSKGEKEVLSSSPAPSSSLLSSSKKAVQLALLPALAPGHALPPRRQLADLGRRPRVCSCVPTPSKPKKRSALSTGTPSPRSAAAATSRKKQREGPNKRQASGCFDAKVTAGPAPRNLDADAVAGPTTAGGTLPPFSWKDDPEFEKVPHRGLPEVFDFEYERFTPRLKARVKGRR